MKTNKTQCDNSPLVSVIVPIYNTEKYLRECLDSIVKQTLEEIEIICVDDGSTDNSRAIIKEYCKKDPRIVFVSQENQGVSVARNAGVSVAQGKYIHFVDSDDWIDPDIYQQFVENAEKHKAEVVRFYDEKSLRRLRRRFPETRALLKSGVRECYVQPTLEERRLIVYLFSFSPCWPCMYRRDFWLANKLQFPPGLRMSEDMLVNYQAIAVAERFAFFKANLYHWRQRLGSASHPISKSKLGARVDQFISYQKARDYYMQCPKTEPLCEQLAIVFAYMQRNNQTTLSKPERAIWRKYVDELLNDRLREVFYKRDALPAQVKSFWLGLYGRNGFERFINAAYSGIFIGLRRFEAFAKKNLIQPFRKKTKFRKTAP